MWWARMGKVQEDPSSSEKKLRKGRKGKGEFVRAFVLGGDILRPACMLSIDGTDERTNGRTSDRYIRRWRRSSHERS